MEKKIKNKNNLVQSAVRATIVVDFPVSYGFEVKDLQEHIEKENMNKLFEYSYENMKIKSSVVVIQRGMDD